MLRKTITKFKEIMKKVHMSPYEKYLNDATDLADLENRIKYGPRGFRIMTNDPMSMRTNSLYYTRGF